MKKFTVPCDFAGRKVPFPVYIGRPHPADPPLRFQAAWIQRQRGGAIPPDVIASFGKLKKISIENNVSFEDLCVYAMGEANKQAASRSTSEAEPPTP